MAKKQTQSLSKKSTIITAGIIGIVGIATLLVVSASNEFVAFEPSKPGTTAIRQDTDAANGSFIEFESLDPGNGNWLRFDQMNLSQSIDNKAKTDANGQKGSMRIVCKTSHFNYDDPIVVPGQRGGAHLHMFFGNTLANFQSTNESLRNTGNGTCSGNDVNRTAYWIPALIDRNERARPSQYNEIYYKSGPLHGKTINQIPEGLVMIAGTANASDVSQNKARYKWHCGFPPNYPNYYSNSNLIPNCKAGDALSLNLVFPQCWDGRNLDSADHASHMAYPNGKNCPSSHPKAIPEITYNIYWNNSDQTTDGWYLASDRSGGKNLPGGTTTHGDWFGAWHPTVMKTFVEQCNNQQYDCKGATISRTQRLINTTTKSLSEGNIFSGSRAPDTPIPVSSIPR